MSSRTSASADPRGPGRGKVAPRRDEAGRLARRLALSTALAWSAGVLALTIVAVVVAARGFHADLDARLRAHALAAYGLAYFGADGTLVTQHLERERFLFEDDIQISIASPDGVVWGPARPDAAPLIQSVLTKNEELAATEGDRRYLAMPTYDDADEVCGVILASASRGPTSDDVLTFALSTGAAALVLMLLGVALSALLARRVLAALLENIRQREQILAGAAHELRTPLATVLAVAESTPPAEAVEGLEQVRATAAGAAGMVRRLLAWSRLADDRLAPEPLRLDLLVEACIEDDETFVGEATVVTGDPRLVEVAVRNLLENARVHGGGVKCARVEGRRFELHDELGAAIDPGALDPFVRGTQSPGTGLGLALVGRIAALHDVQLSLGPPIVLVWPDADTAPPQG